MSRRPRVLIVDDEPNIVLSLQFLLSREGYDIDVARDGESALAIAALTPPDLVVLDLMLPGGCAPPTPPPPSRSSSSPPGHARPSACVDSRRAPTPMSRSRSRPGS